MMDLEEKLQGVKQYSYDKLKVDTVAFEKRLLSSFGKAESKKFFLSRKRLATIAVPLLILPLAGFAYGAKEFIWSGTHFSYSTQENHPNFGTNSATSEYENAIASTTTTQKFNLSDSRLSATFPIRVPIRAAGWRRIVSEGLTFPHQNESDGKIINVTRTPLEFYELYVNEKGQRVSVIQKQDEISESMSQALKKSKDKSLSGGKMELQLRKGAQLLQGFANDIAIFSPNLVDVSLKQENFDELILYHVENNQTVTQFKIDEVGGVSSSELESFARLYLETSTK